MRQRGNRVVLRTCCLLLSGSCRPADRLSMSGNFTYTYRMSRTHGKVRYLPKSKLSYPTAASAAAHVEQTLKFLEGRWKLVILFHLFGGKVLRFSELERAIAGIMHHQLPPKVEYALTDWGQALCPALDALLKWAAQHEVK